MKLEDLITVVIPTSPIPSCPTTTLIEQTINSVRHHLPDCLILIEADGVRPEQEKFEKAYELYLERLEDYCSRPENHTVMQMHVEFKHQAAMLRHDIRSITTPLIFYVEHDLPLLPDFIDFEAIARALMSGQVNQVRLHYWSQILDDHKYLMLDEKPIWIEGAPLIRTMQWSQHPHVARVDFYQKMLQIFSPECRTMIETKIYGVVQGAPWEDSRCAIYAPEPNLRRIWHTHGREEEPKWEEKFIF